MSYVPNTNAEQQAMLEHIGLSAIEDLLTTVPEEIRLQHTLNLPPSQSEYELKRHLSKMAARNRDLDNTISSARECYRLSMSSRRWCARSRG